MHARWLAGMGVLVCVACRTTLVPYAMTPPPMEQDEAIRAIAEAVERQPRGFAPSIVEVTDEKLAVTWQRRRMVFYYDRLSEAAIYKDRRGNYYFVRIRDDTAETVYRVWTPHLQTAQLFVDGLMSMRGHRLAQAHDPQRKRSEDRLRRVRELREEMEAVRREQAEDQRRELEIEPEATETESGDE